MPAILGLPDPRNKGRDVNLRNREESVTQFYKGSQHSMFSPTRTEVTERRRKRLIKKFSLGRQTVRARGPEFAVRPCLLAKVRSYTHKVSSA